MHNIFIGNYTCYPANLLAEWLLGISAYTWKAYYLENLGVISQMKIQLFIMCQTRV